jgi:hypothetical protein
MASFIQFAAVTIAMSRNDQCCSGGHFRQCTEMKVGKVAKAENAHPFYPLYHLSFYGLEKVSAKKAGANFAAEERVEVSSFDGLKLPCLSSA